MKAKAIITVFCIMTINLSYPAYGVIVSKDIEYRTDDITMKGYLVYNDVIKGRRPGVIIVHEWWGLNEYARKRARMLAELGYTAFAIDMYGGGKNTEHPEKAAEFAGKVRKNMAAARARFNSALNVLKKEETVLPAKIAAIGYCFGGGIVLQMALDGAPLSGVVSFHGSLGATYPEDKPEVRSKILICHGADDPHVNASQVQQFQQELDKAGANWQMNIYGDAVHSFTNPETGDDPSQGSAYNKQADIRSWEAMKLFFEEIFYKIPLKEYGI